VIKRSIGAFITIPPIFADIKSDGAEWLFAEGSGERLTLWFDGLRF